MSRVFSRLILAVVLLAACGGARADFQEGLEAYNSGNYLYAFDEFRALALNGDAAAQYRLGVMYAKGQGVPQDDKKAASWYLKAAIQDDTRAQFAIAEMYAKGQGVPQNNKQAATWYLEAADHGFPKAQYNVGLMYAKGQGVPQNFIQAYKWLSLAGDMAVSSKGWIEERMTSEQIKKAQVLAQEWREKFK
jgi:TPR repeat protein